MVRLALYQPDIAQNLGTNLRTCACLNIAVDIIEPCGFPFDDRKLRRSGMDYIDHVAITRHVSWDAFNEYAVENNKRLILLSSKATTNYTDITYTQNDILILGRETAGVPKNVAEQCQIGATIPMQKEMRSLNVAVSGAMVLGEVRRQLPI